MKFNKWTLGLAAVGVVSLTSAVRADESKMSQVQTALSNTTISGYVDVSAQWNIGSQNAYNQDGNGLGAPLYSYGGLSKADGFNLNAVQVSIDRPQDESSWAAGYHVDLMFGPDNMLVNEGPEGGIRQAYLTLRAPVGNGIDFKIGVFDTIIGYESTTDGANPNHTRSYGYTMEPTTHTGVIASYKFCDMVSLQAGVANSSNDGASTVNAVNGRAAFETQKTYLGALALTAPESWGWIKGGVLNLGMIHSVDSASINNGTRDNYYAGITLPTPSDKVKIGAAFDYFSSDTALNVGSGYSYNIAAYATFMATDKLSFSARAEYLNDASSLLGLYASNVSPSFASEVHAEEITLTAQYNLWANVISRLEFRWDHVESGEPFGANNGQGTFNGGGPNKGDSFIVAANFIYQF